MGIDMRPGILPGKTIGRHNFYVSSHTTKRIENEHQSRQKLVTTGRLSAKDRAYVYVGMGQGMMKIGMSADPKARCRRLKIELMFTIPVVVKAAKLVETLALQELGALVGDSEWVRCDLHEAIDAVRAGWKRAERLQHVNPMLSEDESRLLRVAMLGGQ